MENRYSFQGRVALVTGGASGIGAAVASRLEEGGAEVHIFDLGNGDAVTDSSRVGSAVEKCRLDVSARPAAATPSTPRR
jgi:NAD(P)-dependent dehydrogenase (short-subunit alcohol dehydrogenase family)